MHLSLLEHGAYTMLLDSYYAQDGFLPETHRVLFRLCRATSEEEHAAVARVADEFFPIVDGRRTNHRGGREIASASIRINAAIANGKRGGRPRKPSKEKPSGFSTVNPVGNPADNPPETQTGTSPSSNKKRERHASRFEVSALPQDWQDYCQRKRPDLRPGQVFENFRDYWLAQPGRDGLKADWFAAWRTWVRRERQGTVNSTNKFHI